MLSLRLEDQFPATSPAPQKRWLRGAALSIVVHAMAIAVIVTQASRRRQWERTAATVDVARSPAAESITVGLSEQLPIATTSPLPTLDDGGITPRQLSPARTVPAVPPLEAPARAAAASRSGAGIGRNVRATKLATNESIAPAPAPDLTVPPPRPQLAPADPARAAFRAQLRRHLLNAWHADEVFARIDPQRRLEGSLFTTAIQVRLRADGTIERSSLAESSGIPALDQEAAGGLARMEPLPAVPASMLDQSAGWTVLCKFYLDVGLFRFAAEIRNAISEKWRPSRAYAATSDQERKTVARFVLQRDGSLVSAEVVQSAGIDFLDANALGAVRPGMRLPAPPPAFLHQPGPVNVFVAFLHQAGDVRLLKPREDVEEE
jgi:TonB family protein